MTPTSDERREVAARLRELPSDIYSTIKGWEKDGLFIGASLSDEADYSQIHNAVFGCFPAEYIHPGDREELHERLADLIDPTCHVSDEEVTHQPTLNAMVVHAYTCDRCNSPFYMGDVCTYPKPLYCPYCGARLVDDDD